ncbi:MAG: hypothetical protein Q7U68_07835 [Candidatus Roizmanbacteria bacterium]|nr:hypothetical protein [Candidatus Roizmanbacteria bacterium]
MKTKNKKILLFVFGLLSALIAVVANIAQISQWIGIDNKNTSSPTEIIDNLLVYTDTLRKTDFKPLDDLMKYLDEQQKNAINILERQRCLVTMGQFREASGYYSKAFKYFGMAKELDTRIGDPYYAIGNLYYDLALIDLIRKKRFEMNIEDLVCNFTPDEDTKKIFYKATQEFNSGAKHPLIDDLEPHKLITTSLHIIEHRKQQIDNVNAGSKIIKLHPLEKIRLMSWIPAIFPNDKELISNTTKFTKKLIDYAADHPEEFVGLLPLKEFLKK